MDESNLSRIDYDDESDEVEEAVFVKRLKVRVCAGLVRVLPGGLAVSSLGQTSCAPCRVIVIACACTARC